MWSVGKKSELWLRQTSATPKATSSKTRARNRRAPKRSEWHFHWSAKKLWRRLLIDKFVFPQPPKKEVEVSQFADTSSPASAEATQATSAMDPVSFSVNMTTVVSILSSLTKGLSKLQCELRDGSGTLASLVNETNDLRLVLDTTDTALREWHMVSGQTVLPLSFTRVEDSLKGLTKNLNAILDIVHRCLAERDQESGKFLSHIARVKWLKEKKRARIFQKALQESKKDLLVLLEAHNL
jgi:hypothetical protein